MAFFFDRFAVVIAYHADNPDDKNGTEQELAAYDAALNAQYSGLLPDMMMEFGLPNTSDVKSILVVLATLSTGTRPKTKLKNACTYYVSTRPSLPSTVIAVVDPNEN